MTFLVLLAGGFVVLNLTKSHTDDEKEILGEHILSDISVIQSESDYIIHQFSLF